MARSISTHLQDTKSLHEKLWVGLRLFHDGNRAIALPIFQEILARQPAVPHLRMAAACLMAETYRGMGEFARAEQWYELSVDESADVPVHQQLSNAWYLHYRPRAHLGLLLTYRRQLEPNLAKIQSLLRKGKKELSSLRNPDLSLQLNALEGTHLRQRGDLEGAHHYLEEARRSFEGLAPPFLLLSPEHVEALLAQAQLLRPASRVSAGRQARSLLKRANIDSWSAAIAAAVLLHLQLERAIQEKVYPADVAASLEAQEPDAPGELLAFVDGKAELERDPLLLTEAMVLRAAWRAAAHQWDLLRRDVTRLEQHLHGQPYPLVLLRTVEAWALFTLDGEPPPPELALLGRLGREALDELEPRLSAYGCSRALQERWRSVLNGVTSPLSSGERSWLGGDLAELRARLWP